MTFYIVTPVYNAIQWLPSCIRSVADQVSEDINVHHHIQDGGSSDGSLEWLQAWQRETQGKNGYKFTFTSCKDNGMYDAINKAWDIMPDDADVILHLNADEQCTLDALKSVAKAFQQHPEADILLCSHLVVDKKGGYICHRRPVHPCKWCSQAITEIITCDCFHKASNFRKNGLRFDTQWQSLGDFVFYRNLLQTNPRIVTEPGIFATIFTVTGNNLGWSDITHQEHRKLQAKKTRLIKIYRTFAILYFALRIRLCDCIRTKPKKYDLYCENESERREKKIKRPTIHWACRIVGER